jgi:hypothetical protein
VFFLEPSAPYFIQYFQRKSGVDSFSFSMHASTKILSRLLDCLQYLQRPVRGFHSFIICLILCPTLFLNKHSTVYQKKQSTIDKAPTLRPEDAHYRAIGCKQRKFTLFWNSTQICGQHKKNSQSMRQHASGRKADSQRMTSGLRMDDE